MKRAFLGSIVIASLTQARIVNRDADCCPLPAGRYAMFRGEVNFITARDKLGKYCELDSVIAGKYQVQEDEVHHQFGIIPMDTGMLIVHGMVSCRNQHRNESRDRDSGIFYVANRDSVKLVVVKETPDSLYLDLVSPQGESVRNQYHVLWNNMTVMRGGAEIGGLRFVERLCAGKADVSPRRRDAPRFTLQPGDLIRFDGFNLVSKRWSLPMSAAVSEYIIKMSPSTQQRAPRIEQKDSTHHAHQSP